MLGFGFALGLGMQVLSPFSSINKGAIAFFWAALAAGTLALLIVLLRRHKARLDILIPMRAMRQGWGQMDSLSRSMLVVSLLFALILLVVALLAPPNTNDSLRYHMPRVMHWLNNGSLAHYTTAIPRQLYMQTWAELAVMNLLTLWGSDRLVNLVQWSSMLGTLVGGSLIARRLGSGARGQIFAAFFAATLPMGILLTSSPHAVYVMSF